MIKIHSIKLIIFIVILINIGLVSASILQDALIEGYHAPLYTETVSLLTQDLEYIFLFPSLNVLGTTQSTDLIVENEMGVGISNPLSSFHVRLSSAASDSMMISRESVNSGNLLNLRGDEYTSLNFRYSHPSFIIETKGYNELAGIRHLNINPVGFVGINIGNNYPQASLDIGGQTKIRGDLFLNQPNNPSNRYRITNLTNPEDPGDAVNLQFLLNQISLASSKWKADGTMKQTIYYDEGNVLIRENLGVATNNPTQRLTVQGNLRADGVYKTNAEVGTTGQISLFDYEGAECELTISGGIITGIECDEECEPLDCDYFRATHEFGTDVCGKFLDGCGGFTTCGCSGTNTVCGLDEDYLSVEVLVHLGMWVARCVPDTGCNPVVDVEEIEPDEYSRVYCSRSIGYSTIEDACEPHQSPFYKIYYRDDTCYVDGVEGLNVCTDYDFDSDKYYAIVNSFNEHLGIVRPGDSAGFYNCMSHPVGPPSEGGGPNDPEDVQI